MDNAHTWSYGPGYCEMVTALIQYEGRDLNLGNKYGEIPLTSTVQEGNKQIVVILKEAENLNSKSSNEDSYTVL